MDSLLKANFKPKNAVQPDDKVETEQEKYEKKALESIGGSMVYLERNKLLWDKK